MSLTWVPESIVLNPYIHDKHSIILLKCCRGCCKAANWHEFMPVYVSCILNEGLSYAHPLTYWKFLKKVCYQSANMIDGWLWVTVKYASYSIEFLAKSQKGAVIVGRAVIAFEWRFRVCCPQAQAFQSCTSLWMPQRQDNPCWLLYLALLSSFWCTHLQH